jgi:hypothetical protein
VVLVSILPPVGPSCDPIDCSKRQAIEPAFGQLGSEPAAIVVWRLATAHTLAAIERALPSGVAEGYRRWGVGVVVVAEEVGDDLNGLTEESRKKGGFRTSAVDGPRNACALGKANIALTADCMARQKQNVSRRWRNGGRCGRVRQQVEGYLVLVILRGGDAGDG